MTREVGVWILVEFVQTAQEHARPHIVNFCVLDGAESSGRRQNEIGFPELRCQVVLEVVFSEHQARVRIFNSKAYDFLQCLRLGRTNPIPLTRIRVTKDIN